MEASWRVLVVSLEFASEQMRASMSLLEDF